MYIPLMTWKLYALASVGAFLATYVVGFPPSFAPQKPASAAVSQPGGSTTEVVYDLGKQADRLHARITAATAYQEPARDAFRFGATARRRAEVIAPQLPAPPAVAPAPVRPPFALAGIAESTVNGTLERTAILTSLRGVQFAKEGDVLDGGFRVTGVAEGAVTLQSPDDAVETTLRLSDGDAR